VIRLMQEEGLEARARKRLKGTTMSDHDQPVAANLLDRRFEAPGSLPRASLLEMATMAQPDRLLQSSRARAPTWRGTELHNWCTPFNITAPLTPTSQTRSSATRHAPSRTMRPYSSAPLCRTSPASRTSNSCRHFCRIQSTANPARPPVGQPDIASRSPGESSATGENVEHDEGDHQADDEAHHEVCRVPRLSGGRRRRRRLLLGRLREKERFLPRHLRRVCLRLGRR